METTELSKGAIAKFISGVSEAGNKQEISPMLLQIMDIKEDRGAEQTTIVLKYLWRDLSF